MIKKIAWQWEKLDECTQRAKVIGGWVLMRLGAIETENKKKITFKETMVFIADKDHEWIITKPFDPSKPDVPRITSKDFEAPVSKL